MLKKDDSKLISDRTDNYLEMDTSKIPIVEFVCDNCRMPLESRHIPSKVDLLYKL